MNLWTILLLDFARAWDRDIPRSRVRRWAMMLSCGGTVRGLATIGFRVSHAVGRRSGVAGGILKQLNQMLTGCDIAYQAEIGPGLRLLHPTSVVIAPDTVIGDRFTIHSCVTLGGDSSGAPRIGTDVNIGPGAKVVGSVEIGSRVRIGANAVMTRTIEVDGAVADDVVIVGIPAKVLRPIRSTELRAVDHGLDPAR